MPSADPRQFDPQRHGPELSAYLDNELSGLARAEVERLLAASPEARAAAAELREVSDALRSLPREPSPIDFAASVRRDGRIDGGTAAAPGVERVWRIPSALRVLAGAAVLAICVSTTWKLMLPAARPALNASLEGGPADRIAPESSIETHGAHEPDDPRLAFVPRATPPKSAERGGAIGGAREPADRSIDAAAANIPALKEIAGPPLDPAHAFRADQAVQNVVGRIVIPTQNMGQYKIVNDVISAVQRSSGEAPTDQPAPAAAEPVARQLRVPADRASEVLLALSNVAQPEQMRVEVNVENAEPSFGAQLRLILAQATTQPGAEPVPERAEDALSADVGKRAMGSEVPRREGGQAPERADADDATDKSAAAPAASAAAAPASAPAGAVLRGFAGAPAGAPSRGKSATGERTAANDVRSHAEPDATEEVTRKADPATNAAVVRPAAVAKSPEPAKPGEADKPAEADKLAKAAPPAEGAARTDMAGRTVIEEKVRHDAGAAPAATEPKPVSPMQPQIAGGGRGKEEPQSAGDGEGEQRTPGGAPGNVESPRRQGGEKVTALLTRGQRVWDQFSNSATMILNRFGEMLQSPGAARVPENQYLMFDVLVLPPPATQPDLAAPIREGPRENP